MAAFSKSQIDRLGERLKRAPISERDLQLLDEYRRSFAVAHATVVSTVRLKLRLEVTGRSAKSTTSIVAKLLRESIRLTQIQDIAGCRTIVADANEQGSVVATLLDVFPEDTIVVDRRSRPSHGYRAIHVIPRIGDKLVEIQVRSRLQHQWAEFSERLSDVAGSDLKYGIGPTNLLKLLADCSWIVQQFENLELRSDIESDPRLPVLRRKLSDGLATIADAVIEEGTRRSQ